MHIIIKEIDIIVISYDNNTYIKLVELSNIINDFKNKENILDLIYNFNYSNLIVILRKFNEKRINIKKINSLNNLYIDENFRTNFKRINKVIKINIINALKDEDINLLKITNCIKLNKNIYDCKEEKIYFNNEIFVDNKILEELPKNIGIRYKYNQVSIPKYNKNIDSFLKLKEMCIKKLNSLNLMNSTYISRLLYELNIIKKLKFSDYFLIMNDIISFCNSNKIFIGPGRGSSGGALVSYLLDITKLDPIKYNLIFDRFLNIYRTSFPDIDLDIEDENRITIINYLRKKYQNLIVTNIITFNKFGIKSLIRELGKVLKIDKDIINYLINNNKYFKTEKECYSEFKEIFQNNNVYQLAKALFKLKGMPKNTSIHASGVLIFNKLENNIVPYSRLNLNTLITDIDMKSCEKIGLLKLDFLGLRNLTLIKKICLDVGKNSYYDILLTNSIKAFSLLSQGKTLGIFQLESLGIKKLLIKLHPNKIEDLGVILSLYRPGPMKFIERFVRRKNNIEHYNISPKLKDILTDTYGIIVYQEQIMNIIKELTYISMSEADIFRKAISKKDNYLLKQQKNKFIESGIKKGNEKIFLEKTFDLIYSFAGYGFNKSHAIGYAKLCYVMAYLKANYTIYFMKNLIHNFISCPIKIKECFYECLFFNINILPLDINKSDYEMKLENKKNIRIGFNLLISFPNKVIEHIIEIRKNGYFLSLEDFLDRIDYNIVSSKNIIDLILSYAFNKFSKNQKEMIYYVNKQYKIYKFGINIFDIDDIQEKKKKIKDFSLVERQQNEKSKYGFFWYSDPLFIFKSKNQLNFICENKDYFCRILTMKKSNFYKKYLILLEDLSTNRYESLIDYNKISIINMENLEVDVYKIKFSINKKNNNFSYFIKNIALIKGGN